jgi:hypothetical protein
MLQAAGSPLSALSAPRAGARVLLRRSALAGALVLAMASAAAAQPGAQPAPNGPVGASPAEGPIDPSPGIAAGELTAPPDAFGVPGVPGDPGMPAPWVGVATEFVSATSLPWEVMVDQQSACWTPCKLALDGPHWVTLRSRDRRPIRLDIGELGRQPAVVTAHDLKQGTYATGITFTALGGMGVVTGITLTAVGCSTDRSGMCTAGLISGGAGALVTVGGIWLMRQALPRYQVRALERHGLSLYSTGESGGVAGRF